MKLTIETHPEGIKRYAHIRRARGPGIRLCAVRCSGTSRTCTLSRDHRGPHVAHGLFNRVVAVWDAAAAASDRPARTAAPKPRPRPRGERDSEPIGLRVERPASMLAWIRERARHMVSSAEELIFLTFFLAFVGFVVYWTLLILG